MKPKNKELQKERLKVCTPCLNNSTPGEITKTSLCNNCGCVLKIKSNNPESKCPENKWKK